MSAAATGWTLTLTGWVLLIGGIGTENMPALWIAMGIGTATLVLLWWLTRRQRSGRTGDSCGAFDPELPTRRDLIEAQVAIFANQDRDEAAGVHEETDEYLALHGAYYALADQVPWWRRIGVWHAALAEHNRRTTDGARAGERR